MKHGSGHKECDHVGLWSTDFFVINWLSTLSPHQVLGREGGNLIQFRKINLFCEDFLNSIPSSIKWKYFSATLEKKSTNHKLN